MTGERRMRFRLSLARAMRFHRRLVLSPALAGLVLSLLYAAKWPLPGVRVLPIGLLLTTVGIFIGVVAAIVAHRLNPYVYAASGVEQIIGIEPIAVLPDFDEVSDEAAAEHLLVIARAIDQARNQDRLKSCVFTAAAPGAGVSTIVAHVHQILRAMGRSVELVDSSGKPPSDLHVSTVKSVVRKTDEPGAVSRFSSTALVKRPDHDPNTQSAGNPLPLLLIDAAPLLVSTRAEQLARSADCVIVVIESGVTTRAHLRAVVKALEPLEPGAVRFVLNRAGLAKADSAFRRSLSDMEKHLHSESISGSMWPVRSLGFQDEPAADAVRAVSEPVTEAVDDQLPFAVFHWPRTEPAETPLPPVPSPFVAGGPPSAPSGLIQPAGAGEADTPTTPAPKPEPPTRPVWFSDGIAESNESSRHTEPAAEAAEVKSEPVPPAPEPTSRLSALRGTIFFPGLKSLGQRKGLRTADWVNRTSGARESETGVATPVETGLPAPVIVQDQPAGEAPAAPAVSDEPVVQSPAAQIAPPKEFIPVVDSRRARTAGLDYNLEIDEGIRILPAKRGQYRSK